MHQDLVAAERDRLLDLLVELLARQDVGVGVARLAVEGAEVADGGADVGVVDVAVDVVGAVRLGMQPARDGVGGAAQGVQVVAVEQRDALVGRQPLAGDGLVEDWSDVPLPSRRDDAPLRPLVEFKVHPPPRARPSSQASL